MPDTVSDQRQITADFVNHLMPKEWAADDAHPYILFQYKGLLTMEDVSNQRRAFAGPYCRASVDSLQKLFMYRSDEYYNMMFDGGEGAHLIDAARDTTMPVMHISPVTVLYHVPSKRVLASFPDMMEMYTLCDWVEAAKRELHP